MNPPILSREEKELIERFRRNQEISRVKRVVNTWATRRATDPRARYDSETLNILRSLNHDN